MYEIAVQIVRRKMKLEYNVYSIVQCDNVKIDANNTIDHAIMYSTLYMD